MGLISTWIGDVLGISSDERILFLLSNHFHERDVVHRWAAFSFRGHPLETGEDDEKPLP
jgi:hypothetical protein